MTGSRSPDVSRSVAYDPVGVRRDAVPAVSVRRDPAVRVSRDSDYPVCHGMYWFTVTERITGQSAYRVCRSRALTSTNTHYGDNSRASDQQESPYLRKLSDQHKQQSRNVTGDTNVPDSLTSENSRMERAS